MANDANAQTTTVIGWHHDPDAAFAQARAAAKPVFLYWGAGWCPPCNRLKAAVLSQPGFAALAPSFVPLHVDGDAAGAQRAADRLHLRSYPTLVLYRPDGTEITRLPCELAGPRFLEMLQLALTAPFTAAQSLRDALSGQRALSADEWRLLAFYSWDTDEGQLLAGRDLAATLAALCVACTLPEPALRLAWHALHAAGSPNQPDGLDMLLRTLADPQAVLAHVDLVINYAVDLVRALTAPQSEQRMVLSTAWSAALQRLESSEALDPADQLAALRVRVRMARLGSPVAGLNALLRERGASALAGAQEPALRHHVINTAAGAFSDAGLLDDADALLRAALPGSHAPFYFMHNLAAVAKKRGDISAMLDWYQQAWEQASGPATRLQWGATCLLALIDATPDDRERIGRLAVALLPEVDGMTDANCRRNGTQLARMLNKLSALNASSEQVEKLKQGLLIRVNE
ncbi:thioredoxin family protein [Massilia pseudoviolaceinigra]|uniref:thioredoxin family protein n=1 Tax=Massilia pseudoviolaceinigra TaxID=3057165 RepID=UPI002796526F|nr:thioredoxin family protein [Massilia sp. CCM 9206]MDQ1924194.1 thioredoxin family protein [Massilia sp. CCM 9206]